MPKSRLSTYKLTKRRHEVMTLLSQGNNNKEITQALSLAENTVKNHLRDIYFKMGVNSRTKATLLYLHVQDSMDGSGI